MLKLSENPPLSYPSAASLRDLPGRWFVAHTRARFEKAFAFDLLARQQAYFLPMVRRTLISGGRKRPGLLPLFPSYVFFCGDAEDRHAALRTGRLAGVIEVADQQRLINQLCALQRAIETDAEMNPCPLRAGRRCRVIAGALEGIEGVVVSAGNRSRIILEVTLLGQGASMEISADLLEPIDSPVAV